MQKKRAGCCSLASSRPRRGGRGHGGHHGRGFSGSDLAGAASAVRAVRAVRCDSPARRERCCRRRRRCCCCSIWCRHGVLEFRPREPLNTLEPPPYPASCVPGSQTIIAVFPAACSTRVAWHHRKNIRALSGQRHHVTGPHPPRPSWQRTATAHPPSTSYLHLRSAKIAAYCLPAAHSYT
jgi:hypothetical protein